MSPVDNPLTTLFANNWHQDLLNIVGLFELILALLPKEPPLLEAVEDLSGYHRLLLGDLCLE